MEFTIRSNGGRIIGKTFTKESAELLARQNNGYVKDKRDSINPFKEEIWSDSSKIKNQVRRKKNYG